MSDNPYQPPVASVIPEPPPAPPAALANSEPRGLGGWLVLVMIGLIVSPIRIGILIGTLVLSVFQNGTWEALTTPGSEHYHPLWAPLLIFELAINGILILAGVTLLALFFTKSRRFPRMFILYVAVTLIFQIADYVLAEQIPAVAAEGAESLVEIARTVITAIIWVPYMLVSKRVKNTFV